MSESRKISPTVALFWAGVVIVGLMGAVLALFWNRLPPQLPWFYSFPTGEKQLVWKMWLVWILLGMEAVLFFTRVIANWAGKNDTTVQKTIMIGVVAAVGLVAASFARIMMIFLNI